MASLTLWEQFEVVRKKAYPIWILKKFNLLTDFIKKGEVEQIGERDFRIPFLKTYGGRFGAYDPQMGDMGRGTMPTGDKMIGSYFNLRLNFEMDMLALKATQDRKVALTDPFKDSVARGFLEFMVYIDKVYHSNGTALVGTATAHSSGSGVSVYTMDNIFGTQLVRRGQYLNVYGASLTTLKSAGQLYITAVNTIARTITLSGIVPGAAATDTFTFEGVSGNSPTGLRGVYYWISEALSGTTAGINRALEPEIVSNYVDGSTLGFTPEVVMALQHRMYMRRGEVMNGLLGICAPPSQAFAYNNMMSVQNIRLESTKAEAVDRLPDLKLKQAFMWGNLPWWVDISSDASKNVVFLPAEFGRARLDEMKPFQIPGSNQKFFQLYGGSGAPAAGVWFSNTVDEDLYHINPGNTGVIYGLPRTGLYA
jgi:hypothetical protein